jgi:hypothetical protein
MKADFFLGTRPGTGALHHRTCYCAWEGNGALIRNADRYRNPASGYQEEIHNDLIRPSSARALCSVRSLSLITESHLLCLRVSRLNVTIQTRGLFKGVM